MRLLKSLGVMLAALTMGLTLYSAPSTAMAAATPEEIEFQQWIVDLAQADIDANQAAWDAAYEDFEEMMRDCDYVPLGDIAQCRRDAEDWWWMTDDNFEAQYSILYAYYAIQWAYLQDLINEP